MIRTIPQLPYFHEDEHENANAVDDDYRKLKTVPESFIPIPSDEHPSDHIPIGVVLTIS